MIQLQQNNYIAELFMADVVVDGEFLLEWCEFFGQPQVWYISCVYNTSTSGTLAM